MMKQLTHVELMEVSQMLRHHEGFRSSPYIDTVGKLTIGFGRNLDDVGISYNEALDMLRHDIGDAHEGLSSNFPWFDDLSFQRKAALINMAFNLGIGGLKTFKKMIAALEKGQFETVALEALDSEWAQQVGDRAKEIADMFKEV